MDPVDRPSIEECAGILKRALIAAVLAGLSACAPAATTGDGRADPVANPDEVARQAAVVDSVRRTYTQADIDFMAGMIHHHAQALVMSRMAPTHGASASLQVMAERIINSQKDEIDLMQRWLRNRDLPVPEPEAAGGHAAAHDHAMMPGMLTAEQLANLDAARGEEFDRLYLQYMIQHHQGAVTMVENLVATRGGAREETVFKLASDIGADQASEITRMQTMLRDLLFSGEDTP